MSNLATLLPMLLSGLVATLQLTAASLALGLALAALLTAMRLSGRRSLVWPALAYSLYFRGTPLLIQIMLVYYGSGQFRAGIEALGLWPMFRSPWFCAILAFTLNTAAYTAEIMLGAIRSVPPGTVEAAAALGLRRSRRFRLVTRPLAIRAGWPAYGNEVIFQVQATSLASVITIMDLTGVARKAAARSFDFFGTYTVTALLYLCITGLIVLVFRAGERRMRW